MQSFKRKTLVAIDIDGTLRDLESQIDKYLENDYPEKHDGYTNARGKEYRTLDGLFFSREEIIKWLYEDRPFELFGMAGKVHRKVIDDLNILYNSTKGTDFEIVIASVQFDKSVPATLHWLAKNGCKVQKIFFFDTMKEKIDAGFDIYVDDCPEVLNFYRRKKTKSKLSRAIKVPYEFNKGIKCPVVDIVNGKFDDLYGILGIEKVLKK